MSERTREHRRAQKRVLIGWAVVAVLIVGFLVARRSVVSQPNIEEMPAVALNGSVSCSGAAIQITNNDAFGWMDARVEVDSKYARTVPSIPPRQTVTLPTSELTDSNGGRFDPATMKCQSADVQAYMRGGRGHFTAANLDAR